MCVAASVENSVIHLYFQSFGLFQGCKCSRDVGNAVSPENTASAFSFFLQDYALKEGF